MHAELRTTQLTPGGQLEVGSGGLEVMGDATLHGGGVGDTVLQQRAGSLNIKRLLLIKENQRFQIKELTVSLCLGRCKSLASLKSFFSYVSQLSGASIL